MEFWQIVLLPVYCVSLGLLLVFSFHRLILVRLYFRHADRVPPQQTCPEHALPAVTVQLPIYNECYVVERLICTVGALDYPRDRLEIQVLDDSTDVTSEITRRCVADLVAKGVDAHYIHRVDRVGYKAGALQAGLSVARGACIAIFDADFLPPNDFLLRTVPHLVNDEGVGMVQARWGHLNRDYSLLTKVQSIFLDGHFVMEHGARSRAGLFFNFNGTAGVWRKRCIDEAGGWQHETLTEDLDLSYRAQLAGWQFKFLQDVVVPAEIPVTASAWKSQQFRWAKGSVQTAKKLLGLVLRSTLPLGVKAEAVLHLCANASYLLIALLSVLLFPAVLSCQDMGWYRLILMDIPLFAGASAVVSRFYVHSQREIYADWVSRMKYIPCALALGIGISLNNTRGVIEALRSKESAFLRTPKFSVTSGRDRWVGKRYLVGESLAPLLELSMGVYLALAIWFCLGQGIYFPLLFLFLFSFGFLYTGIVSLHQAWVVSSKASASRMAAVEAEAAD